MKKLIFIISFLLIGQISWSQQLGQFTQFLNIKQQYNPAYVGARSVPSLSAIYRQQWIGYEGAPQNYYLGFNAPFINDRVGFGVGIQGQSIGITQTWQASMAYSYNVQINEKNGIRFGFQGSVKNYRFDFADESTYLVDEDDGSILDQMQSNDFTGNFGFGIYADLDKIFIGASIPSFYPNDIGFNNDRQLITAGESQHWYFLVGGYFPIGNNIVLSPGILGKYVQHAPFDVDVQLSGTFAEKITAGVNYRLGGDSIGESVGLNLIYQINLLALGVAYDIGMSELSQSSSGSFELLVRYDFRQENTGNLANPRYQF